MIGMRNWVRFSEISTNTKWNEPQNERTVYPDEVANGYVKEQNLSTEVHNSGFCALNKETQSPVAVKMTCQSRDDHDGLSPSSFREIGIVMLFSYRNIVGVIDARRCPNGIVLVMEWISRSSRDHPGRSSELTRDLIRSHVLQYLDRGKYLSERRTGHGDF
jgi:serine/threonine protein kinase